MQRDGGRKSRVEEQGRGTEMGAGKERKKEGRIKTGTGSATYRWREKRKDREQDKGTEK